MTLKEWMDRYNGGETEPRELAESLVRGRDRAPALRDAPDLCSAAKDLIAALDRFDRELENVGFGD